MKNAACAVELDVRNLLRNKQIPQSNLGDIILVDKMEYSNRQISNLIDEYVHKERDRCILKRRMIDGVGFEKLAEEFDLSVRQTKNIVYKTQEKLFKHMDI